MALSSEATITKIRPPQKIGPTTQAPASILDSRAAKGNAVAVRTTATTTKTARPITKKMSQ